MQGSLITLESPGTRLRVIVSALVKDLLGDRALAAHRINGRDAASQREAAEDLRQSGDLVGYPLGVLVDLDLSQDQAVSGGPGADHADGVSAVCTVMRVPDGLAIQGNDMSGEYASHGLHPLQQAGAELGWIESLKDPIEGVMGGTPKGYPMGQVQEGGKQLGFDLPELLDVVPTLGTTNDRTDRDGDDTGQGVQSGTLRVSLAARVVQGSKVIGQGQGRGGDHSRYQLQEKIASSYPAALILLI